MRNWAPSTTSFFCGVQPGKGPYIIQVEVTWLSLWMSSGRAPGRYKGRSHHTDQGWACLRGAWTGSRRHTAQSSKRRTMKGNSRHCQSRTRSLPSSLYSVSREPHNNLRGHSALPLCYRGGIRGWRSSETARKQRLAISSRQSPRSLSLSPHPIAHRESPWAFRNEGSCQQRRRLQASPTQGVFSLVDWPGQHRPESQGGLSSQEPGLSCCG